MQFRDLQAQYRKYKIEIDAAIGEVLAAGDFIGGKAVGDLETRLASYVGVKHCISCANGTDALSLVMMAWEIGPGDAVFVPDFTFFSTGEIVSLAGAVPVFVDVDPDTFNLDPAKLEAAVKKVLAAGKYTPRAVIPVDLFGLPADYPAIGGIADKYGLLVLEDGAQGFGGEIGGKKTCGFGAAATTSFFPAKPLGCYGDGGAVFTDDDGLAKVIGSLKVHGKGADKYDNIRIGMNSRLDTIQAAVLGVKLEALVSHELNDVNRIFDRYSEKLAGLVRVPRIPEGFFSSFAQYTIRLENETQRDGLQKYLKEKGIPAMVYYARPMHRQPAFAGHEYDDADYEVADLLCRTVLSLPMHPYLKEEDIDLVTGPIVDYISRK